MHLYNKFQTFNLILLPLEFLIVEQISFCSIMNCGFCKSGLQAVAEQFIHL